MSPLPRRFRSFSLRTLMVLVTLSAIAVWVANGHRLAGQRRAILEREKAGDFPGIAVYERPPEHLSGMRRLFADPLLNEIQIYEWSSAADVAEVRRAFPEAPSRWYREQSPGKWIVTKEVFASADPVDVSAARLWLASPQVPVQEAMPP